MIPIEINVASPVTPDILKIQGQIGFRPERGSERLRPPYRRGRRLRRARGKRQEA